ncbi:MAG: electron transfer flavoprotein subunit alpha/FixB family protein [Eubacterium sp.]|nr:electron transfer flavoprotein subunit alpha/FixB family protein [Eubacterium sp.]
MSKVLVFASVQDGVLPKGSREILNAGKELSSVIGAEVEAVVVGADATGAAEELAKKGASKVYCASDTDLAGLVPDLYLTCIENAVKQSGADTILFDADSTGRDLGPKLAYRLGASLITEATTFVLKDGKLIWNRPCYGGNAMSTVITDRAVQVLTIRPHSYDADLADADSKGEIVNLPLEMDAASAATKVLEVIKEASKGLGVEDASVVVSGGRGIGSAEAFAGLQELADVLGGAVGASRAATDAGWASVSQQVGQTGKIIAPDLYIAIGISGASQHLTGITNAKNVIAINKDENAPIFQRATLGIVADYKSVLPELIEQCKKLIG